MGRDGGECYPKRMRPSRIPLLPLVVGLALPLPVVADEFGDRVRQYLLDNPQVILEALDVLAEREAAAKAAESISQQAPVLFDPAWAEVLGDPAAPYRIVELFDYKCLTCKAVRPTLEAFVAARPDVAVLIQHLPILGPQSDRAARAYLAVRRLEGPDAAAALHDRLSGFPGVIRADVLAAFTAEIGLDPETVEQEMYGAEVSQRVDAIRTAAIALGVTGTPVFLGENGVHQGAVTQEDLARLLDEPG